MAWKKLGSTTLTGTVSIIDVPLSAAEKFNQGVFYCPHGQNGSVRSGNSTVDTGANYAYRSSRNGGADSTATSNSTGMRVNDNAGSTPNFVIIYTINISGEEKLLIGNAVEQMTAGAGTPPNTNESVGKHVFTSNPVDIFQMNHANMPSGTNFTILGTD